MFRKRNNLLRTTLSEDPDPDKDEFLEYYRQYRHPEALPEGYIRRMDSTSSLPIESYYNYDSHYHQRQPGGLRDNEEYDDDRLSSSDPSPKPQRRHRWCSSLLGSLKRRKKPTKSRPSLRRIPIEDHYYNNCDQYGSCYSTVTAAAAANDVDSQSRDSGHSSGSSLPTFDFSKELVYDNHSIYSYNTARDDEDSGVGSSTFSCHDVGIRRPPLPSPPPPEMLQRQLREWQLPEKPSKPAEETSSLCSRLFWGTIHLLKMALMLMSLAFISLAVFSAYRSHTCSVARQSQPNVTLTRVTLEKQLFGQPEAVTKLIRDVEQFYTRDDKAMVLLLSGSSGTGKSHTMDLLRLSFHVPSNIHQLSWPTMSDLNAENLLQKVKRGCGHHLILIDDLDDSCQGIPSNVANLVKKLEGSGTLVVISTTAASDLINEKAVEIARQINGLPKLDSDSYANISEEVLERLGLSDWSHSKLSVIPFMPLGRDSVRKCVGRAIAVNHNLVLSRFESRKAAEQVMEELEFFSQDFPVFSSTGCKKVNSKVDVMLTNEF